MTVDDAIARVKLMNSLGEDAFICEKFGGELCVLSEDTKKLLVNRNAQLIEICRVAR
tara:strand:+ start:607 stop:777 length:171 start_codon:yes stop_codon:yes gene_type:complete